MLNSFYDKPESLYFNEDTHRKREQRSRMELGGRLDKMGSAIEDVTEWEHRVEESQDTFQKISEVIKVIPVLKENVTHNPNT